MALIKCKECGAEISSKAEACPKCGAKPPKKTSLFTWLVLIIIVLAVIGVFKDGGTSRSVSSNTASSTKSTATTASTKPALPEWSTSTSKDKMTGKKSAYAFSPSVPATKKMSFPYSGVTAWLGVGCNSGSEWAYIGFSEAPNLTKTETEDGYNVINTRVKWNEKVVNARLIQNWGAAFLHFSDDVAAIQNMKESSYALLELSWYGERATYFKFPLRGSTSAINKIRQTCKKY